MGLAEVIINNPIISVIIIAIVVNLITTLVHKRMTNQEHLKSLKERQKEIQKELRKTKDAKAMTELNAEAFKIMGEMMKSSFKSLYIIIIPIIIFISWGNANVGYYPFTTEDNITITADFSGKAEKSEIRVPEEITLLSEEIQEVKSGEAEWMIRGDEGKHTIEILTSRSKLEAEIVITNSGVEYPKISQTCGFLCSFNSGEEVKRINLNSEKRIYLNLFGWELGWLGAYIIYSIIASMIIRKVLKVA